MNSSPGSEELQLAPAPDGSAEAQAMPGVVDHVAVARLYGEPLFALPKTCTSRPTRWRSFSKPSKARWTCCCT
jgi:hypothetical protein